MGEKVYRSPHKGYKDTSVLIPTAADPLKERRHEEKEFVRLHDTAKSSVWYIIDINWLESWRRFINERSDPPGNIDNTRLVHKDSGDPVDGLSPVKDFRGVNSAIWMFWHGKYGGGPALRRRILDLYSQPMPDPGDESAHDLYPPPPTPAEFLESEMWQVEDVAKPSRSTVHSSELSSLSLREDGFVKGGSDISLDTDEEIGQVPVMVAPGQLVLAEYGGGWYFANVSQVRGATCDVAWLRPHAEDWGSNEAMRRYLCSTGADETLNWHDLPIGMRIRLPERDVKQRSRSL